MIDSSDYSTPSASMATRATPVSCSPSTTLSFCSLAKKTLIGPAPLPGGRDSEVRGRASSPGLVEAAIGLDDVLHDPVADNVTAGQVGERQPVDPGQDVTHDLQPGALPRGQVDLGDVAGHDRLGVEPEPGEKHL